VNKANDGFHADWQTGNQAGLAADLTVIAVTFCTSGAVQFC